VNLADRLTLSNDVVAREVGGESILLDLANGNYFGLNPVGSRIWHLLDERGCTLAGACDVLAGEYDVERSQLEADVLALAQQLVDQDLAAASSGP
jgi:hypothetical protein